METTDSVWCCPVCYLANPIASTGCSNCGHDTASNLENEFAAAINGPQMPAGPSSGSMTISGMCDIHHAWLEAMGWNNSTALEDLALVASEFGEAVDELPEFHPDKARFADLLPAFARAVNAARGDTLAANFGQELADIVLRVAGVAKENGINLEQEIVTKMTTNHKNGNHKGRKK